MSVLNSPRTDVAPDALSFDRAVDRRYVHRWALSEVFITDFRVIDEKRSVVGAMLPTSHTYYGDHLGPGATVDTMALMECARQAATYLAHQGLGVPLDSAFLVARWGLWLSRATWPRTGSRPGQVSIEVTTDPLIRGAVVRGAGFAMRLFLDGLPLATVDVEARYTPVEEADLVRRYRRGSAPPPWSTSLPEVPPGRPVPPAEVNRRDPANVVLFDATGGDGQFTARLGTRPDHRGFYDHPQDHYTAMILMEAARQMGLLATGGAAGAPRAVSAYQGHFARFAELDAPVVVEAPVPVAGADLGVAVPVRFRQGGDVVSEVTVTVSQRPSPATGEGRS